MMEFTFEKAPWEQALDVLQPGDTIDALKLMSLLEEEDEDSALEVLDKMEQRGIALSIENLPNLPTGGNMALRLREEAQLVASGKLLTGLSENDPLRLYLEELAATPAAGDTAVTAQAYLEGDEAAGQKLVTLSLSRVVELASELAGRNVLLLDLIQEGSMGLWQSLLSYETGDFSEHAQGFISRYMARIVVQQARDSGAGQKLRQGMEDYLDVDQRLLTELGRNPVTEEIAEAMHISAEEVRVIEKMVMTARNMERAHEAQKEPEPSLDDDQAVEDTAYFRLRQQIAELLSGLSETDAKLLTMRFGLEGGAPMTPTQVGNTLGLTPEQVVKREAAALAKLRNQ